MVLVGRQAKVPQLELPAGRQEAILGLDVPVHDADGVQQLQDGEERGDDVAGDKVLLQPAVAALGQQLEQISLWKSRVQMVWCPSSALLQKGPCVMRALRHTFMHGSNAKNTMSSSSKARNSLTTPRHLMEKASK